MNQSTKRLILILTLFSVVVGAIYFFQSNVDNDVHDAIKFKFEDSSYSETATRGDTYQTFTHPTYGFSVEYPSTFITEAYKENAGGETIVFQSEGDQQNGFQIFISDFGKDEVITRERILEDVPFVTIDEPQKAVIGDGIEALIFWSEDPRVGRTREVWFVHGGQLYEITTYAELDTWLAHIMQTWKFM